MFKFAITRLIKGFFFPPSFFFFEALAGARRSGFTAYNSWHKGSAAAAAEPKQEEAIFPPRRYSEVTVEQME